MFLREGVIDCVERGQRDVGGGAECCVGRG